MIVSELAQFLGITADTVRFYTREGFLAPARNKVNGYKEYSNQDKSRLRFILSARNLGFTVEDIRQILGKADQGKTACPLVRQVISERLQQMEQLRNLALGHFMQLSRGNGRRCAAWHPTPYAGLD